MRQFSDAVREIRGTLAGIIIFFIILDTTIVFLIVYLVLSILDLYPWSAIIPALFYLGLSIYRETQLNKIRIVEKYYPDLNEKLRTAADHASIQNNEVVDELHKEVIDELKKVSAASFFNRKETFTKIASVVLICFVIIFTTALNLNLGPYKDKLFDSVQDTLSSDQESGPDEGDPEGIALGGTGKNQDIYGQRSVALLGEDEIEMQIRPSSYEFIIRDSGELEDEEQFDNMIPPDVTAVESRNYREDIPDEKDKQQLIKDYFKKLAEG
ncbi:hypothetical protein GF345_00720 [Candidatus Woesearchaeota archaeon]|nr:hypothetical protein [Candidatus Woesearchaeota archaeon]